MSIATVAPKKDYLVCGSTENGGLLKSELDAFDIDLAKLREHPKANKEPLWGLSKGVPGIVALWFPWSSYSFGTVQFVPFNGCSATVMQNFAMLHYTLDCVDRKHDYDNPALPKLPNLDKEKFREYVLYRLFTTYAAGTPLFLNLPPPGIHYNSARKFLAKHKAEIACEFVNPNYPDRTGRKEYTTLYVFNHRKWMSPGQPEFFKGLIK